MKALFFVLSNPRTALRRWLLQTPTPDWLFETLKPLAGIRSDYGR